MVNFKPKKRLEAVYKNHPSPLSCYTDTYKGHKFIRSSTTRKKLHGLTPAIHDLLCPDYNFKTAKTVDPTVPTLYMTSKTDKANNIKHIKGGFKTGIKFDQDSIMMFKLFETYPFIKTNWFENKIGCDLKIKKYKDKIEVADQKKIKELARRRVPYVRNVIKLFEELNWQMVAFQYPVCYGTVATWLDFIVWDKIEEQMITIEFKTGMEKTLNLGSGHKMKTPLTNKSDALWHHGLIQAAMGDLMYRSDWGSKYKIGQPKVIRATSFGIVKYEKPKWLKEKELKILDKLKNYQPVKVY